MRHNPVKNCVQPVLRVAAGSAIVSSAGITDRIKKPLTEGFFFA